MRFIQINLFKFVTAFNHFVGKFQISSNGFIQHACSAAADAGFMSNVENTKNGARNIIIGDVNSASVIYTAHYDTAAKSPIPSFIFPKFPILTTLYQMAVAIAMLIPTALAFALCALVLPLIYYLGVCAFIYTYAAYPVIKKYMIDPVDNAAGKSRDDNENDAALALEGDE